MKKSFLIDMDGVLVHGERLILGADQFIERLIQGDFKFLILTNNSIYTPGDLAHRFQSIGLKINENQIFTSAMATAAFLQKQKPQGKAFVIGESGLTEAIHNIGYILTNNSPDYVILGETFGYNIDLIKRAIRLIGEGAKFIATNPDPSGPSEDGLVPACGAMAALIEKVTGKEPFFIGKPNPLMMRTAINYMNSHSEDTIMIGDRMDTDIVAGVMSGLETILVLSGVTELNDVQKFPYQPTNIYNSVATIDLKLE